MSYIFNTVGLIGKSSDPAVGATLNEIVAYLKAQSLRVLLDNSVTQSQRILVRGWEAADRRAIGRQCDLAIVVGGDGTLLAAARSLVDFQVPILGVNLGRLGFLADISPGELINRLDEILNGHYREDQRSLLHAEVRRGESTVTQADALNDVVVHKREMARMIEIRALLDGRYVTDYRADGLIISTPTGSTAYALSSGGPIVAPNMEAVLLVPICPHTLTQRPLMVDVDSEIEIQIDPANSTDIQVTCDGQVGLDIRPGDRVVIRKKRRRLRLLHPTGHDYFQLLRAKLGWGVRPEREDNGNGHSV